VEEARERQRVHAGIDERTADRRDQMGQVAEVLDLRVFGYLERGGQRCEDVAHGVDDEAVLTRVLVRRREGARDVLGHGTRRGAGHGS
jgi:hypothetical protein